MSVRIKPRTHKTLDGTAVVNKVEDYVDIHQWQIDRIRQGLREANEGVFAPAAEVNRVIARLRIG